MTEIPDEIVEAAARSDAQFDGRDFDKLGRADRERYLARSKAALSAALPMLVRAEREVCAQVAGSYAVGVHKKSVAAEQSGDKAAMYQHNNALHEAWRIEAAIHSRGEP